MTSSDLAAQRAAFRTAFLTAVTWECTPPATPTELAYALATWRPTTTPANAVAMLKQRRALAERGRLKQHDRESGNTDNESED